MMSLINSRNDIVNILNGSNNIGLELGVAKGKFSKTIIESNKFIKVFGVDVYNDHHNTLQYINAMKSIGLEKNYTLIRCYFHEALQLFEDNFFDFIYIDGYAHTGQNEGQTLKDWYPKLKNGGIFAGHDYHRKWPLVVKYVNDFFEKNNLNLNLTMEEDPYYPSWYAIK